MSAPKKAKGQAGDGLKDATEKAKIAKEKTREILSTLHHSDADDPNLQAALEEIKLAKVKT